MSELQDPRALVELAGRHQSAPSLRNVRCCCECGMDWPCLTARLGAWLEQVAALLPCLVDDGECWFDHHGGCQEHAYLSLKPGEKCPQAELKEIVSALGSES